MLKDLCYNNEYTDKQLLTYYKAIAVPKYTNKKFFSYQLSSDTQKKDTVYCILFCVLFMRLLLHDF